MWASRFTFLIKFFGSNLISTKKAWITLSAKRLQLLQDFVLRPPAIFYCSAKLNNFQKSNNQYRFVHECGQLNIFSNHACCCLFQTFSSKMHQNEWFQVRFFKNFLGRGSPSSLPRPRPPFFIGLRPQFSGVTRFRLGLWTWFLGVS